MIAYRCTRDARKQPTGAALIKSDVGFFMVSTRLSFSSTMPSIACVVPNKQSPLVELMRQLLLAPSEIEIAVGDTAQDCKTIEIGRMNSSASDEASHKIASLHGREISSCCENKNG
jgi:hypothetical protein